MAHLRVLRAASRTAEQLLHCTVCFDAARGYRGVSGNVYLLAGLLSSVAGGYGVFWDQLVVAWCAGGSEGEGGGDGSGVGEGPGVGEGGEDAASSVGAVGDSDDCRDGSENEGRRAALDVAGTGRERGGAWVDSMSKAGRAERYWRAGGHVRQTICLRVGQGDGAARDGGMVELTVGREEYLALLKSGIRSDAARLSELCEAFAERQVRFHTEGHERCVEGEPCLVKGVSARSSTLDRHLRCVCPKGADVVGYYACFQAVAMVRSSIKELRSILDGPSDTA